MKINYRYFSLSIIITLFFGCAKQPIPVQETILAKVGSKTS